MCSELNSHFYFELERFYPPGAEDLSKNHLFGIFHASTPPGYRVNTIIIIVHYDVPPQSIEDYFQESGRGGRSGENTLSIIYRKPFSKT